MQIQPHEHFSIEGSSVLLPKSFPVSGVGNHTINIRQITYMHYHDCVEMGLCCEGSGLLLIGNQVQPFSAGDAYIIFKDVAHIHQSESSHPGRLKIVSLDAASLLANIAINNAAEFSHLWAGSHQYSGVLYGDEHPDLLTLIAEIAVELEHAQEH